MTGLLDKETVDMMLKPRCGVKDFIDDDEDVDTPRIKIKVKSTLSRKKVRPLSFKFLQTIPGRMTR